MVNRVIAVLDASECATMPALEAARLATAANADLILAFDPRSLSFAPLSEYMSHCVDQAVRMGARTSTMLVEIEDPTGTVHRIRSHHADLVVVEDDGSDSSALGKVMAALTEASVPIWRVLPESPALGGLSTAGVGGRS